MSAALPTPSDPDVVRRIDSRPPPISWRASVELLPAAPVRRLPSVAAQQPGRRPRVPAWPVAPRPGLPAAGPWAGRLAVLVVQALAGERPYGQLAKWLTPAALASVADRLAERPERERQASAQVRLLSLRVQHPRAEAAEVAAHLSVAGRSMAVALRLDAFADRWLCSALALPPVQTASEVWME
jgi:hypothetical protein